MTKSATRPQLLISVRNGCEALEALEGGADLLDVKDPSRGPLGRPHPEAVAEVVAVAQSQACISVALGEIGELSKSGFPTAAAFRGVSYIKIGLSEFCNTTSPQQLARLATKFREVGIAFVSVQYADWQTCGAPSPKETLEIGNRLASPCLLIDTCDKLHGNLLDHMPVAQLQEVLSEARQRGMRSAVAGSLRPSDFARVAEAEPDIVAVRTAACVHDKRLGAVCKSRVAHLRSLLQ